MSLRVDLNCDCGESFGHWQLGLDEEILRLVSSANVACGFHAGDPGTMRRTVALAAEAGVAIGAHPGLPDRLGFGRRALAITPEEGYDLVLYQVGALDGFVRAAGARLGHVKPHGALYTMAAKDDALAEALVAATRAAGRGLIFVGMAGTAHERAAARLTVPFAAEVFADRTVLADGTLTPRSRSDAFVADPGEAAERVVTMVRDGRVRATSGEWIAARADTVCLHGDNPAAVSFARALRERLGEAGFAVAPLQSLDR